MRFLRKFGGFIAKMRSKMTKMRVSKFDVKFESGGHEFFFKYLR